MLQNKSNYTTSSQYLVTGRLSRGVKKTRFLQVLKLDFLKPHHSLVNKKRLSRQNGQVKDMTLWNVQADWNVCFNLTCEDAGVA